VGPDVDDEIRKELRLLRSIEAQVRERPDHRRRRQVALGRLTPIEYAAIMTTLANQAA
jgi:hypothetical protein